MDRVLLVLNSSIRLKRHCIKSQKLTRPNFDMTKQRRCVRRQPTRFDHRSFETHLTIAYIIYLKYSYIFNIIIYAGHNTT